MIKRIAALLLGIAFFSQPASAQTGKPASTEDARWILYQRTAPDGKPLVIVARIGKAAVREMLLNGHATVVNCQADQMNVNDQGMPQGTERLYALEDKLDEEPALLAAGTIHVASVTGQGARRMFYVHRDPLDLSLILKTVHIKGFSCEAVPVTDRQSMIRLTTPSPLEIQLNGDQDVIANLIKNGDDGHLPRKTDFWFYGERGSLKSLSDILKSHGLSIDHWLKSPSGIVLSREMPVDLTAFQAITPVLVDAAEQSGVEYDGWETSVVSKRSAKPDSANP